MNQAFSFLKFHGQSEIILRSFQRQNVGKIGVKLGLNRGQMEVNNNGEYAKPFCSAGIVHLILAFFGANFPFRLRGMHFTTSCVGLNFLSRHLTLHVDPPLDVVSQSIFIAVGSILKYENAFPHRVSASI